MSRNASPIASSQGGKRPLSPAARRWAWSAAILCAVLLLLFVPPLINANRYRLKIASSMSASLGRPVHLDSVTLHLLPLPGLTISNLVVSEDPAFGEEPVIRANTVEATLRLGSLWRRQVEFSNVRFVEPSVNLVRNAAGRWNLSEVLVNASKLDAAPTDQRRAGPAPRFPYIEATGARVNIKQGNTKLPFSLTDADFALWLPSARQWRVRLKGSPLRTDTEMDEPGVVRVEGTLERAPTAAQVPVDLRASWHDVPLGDASLFLTGEDLGWRGMLDVDLVIHGRLGDAETQSQVTLDGLRRAAFSPPHPLDLQVFCGAGLQVEAGLLRNLQCTLPDSGPAPAVLRAAQVDLTHPHAAEATLDLPPVPLHWGMLWAALFSARVPTDLYPEGSLSLHLVHGVPSPTAAEPSSPPARRARRAPLAPAGEGHASDTAAWRGQMVVSLPSAPSLPEHAPPAQIQFVWETVGAPSVAVSTEHAGGILPLALRPVTVSLGSGMSLNLTAVVGQEGYTVSGNGNANAALLLQPARYLPSLGDGTEAILPYPPTGLQPEHVDFVCTKAWNAAQTCVGPHGSHPAGRVTGVGAAIVPVPQPQQPLPGLLQPKSLSPLDRNPALGGQPAPGATSPLTLPHL